jgi:type I restriction-modification system DNA methylase subunit
MTLLKTYKNMNSDNNGKTNECYTRFIEAEKLINFLNGYKELKNRIIWCPFDEKTSNIVMALKNAGYKVIYSHINTGQDFLNYTPNFDFDIMISNPPFSKRTKFFNKINSYNKPYIMLQPIMFFNNNSMIRELTKYSKRYRFLCPTNRMGFIVANGKKYTEKDKTTAFYCFWLCKDLFLNENVFTELTDLQEKVR